MPKDVDDESSKQNPQEQWKAWENVVQEILGDAPNRIRASSVASKISDASGSDPDISGKVVGGSETEFFDANGQKIESLETRSSNEPFVGLKRDGSSRVIEVFSTNDDYRNGNALLTERFSYKEDDSKVVEERKIETADAQSTLLKTTYDKNTAELTFATNFDGIRQEIGLDGNSQLQKFEMSYADTNLSYQIENGLITGVKLSGPNCKDDNSGIENTNLDSQKAAEFIAAANLSLQTLRENNGIPEPIVDRALGSPANDLGFNVQTNEPTLNDDVFKRRALTTNSMLDALVSESLKNPDNQAFRSILADVSPHNSQYYQPNPLQSALKTVLEFHPDKREQLETAALQSVSQRSDEPLKQQIADVAANDPNLARAVREIIGSHLRSSHNEEKGQATDLLMALSPKWSVNDFNAALQSMQPNQVKDFAQALSSAPIEVKQAAFNLAIDGDQGRGHLLNTRLSSVERASSALNLGDSGAPGLSPIQARMRLITEQMQNSSPLQHDFALPMRLKLSDSNTQSVAFTSNPFDSLRNPFMKGTEQLDRSKDSQLLRAAFPQHSSSQFDRLSDSSPRSGIDTTYLAETLESSLSSKDGKAASVSEIFARWGVAHENFAAEINAASTKYGEQTLRDLDSRVQMYNALNPAMREQIAGTGNGDPVDERLLAGLVLNQRLDTPNSPYSFLIDKPPIEQKLTNELEKTSRDLNQSEVELYGERHDKDSSLQSLEQHTKTGVSAQDLLEHGVEKLLKECLTTTMPVKHLTPGKVDFFTSGVEAFADKQTGLIKQFRADEKSYREKANKVASLSAAQSQLEFAKSVYDYEALTQSSTQQLRKDYVGLVMLDRYGVDTIKGQAPHIWKDLSEGGLARLKELNLVQGDQLPDIKGTRGERLQQAMLITDSLSKVQEGNLDFAIRRRQALDVFDGDESLLRTRGRVLEFGDKFASFSKLFESGNQGTKYEEFVKDLKSQAGELEELLGNTSAQDIRDLRDLRVKLNSASDSASDLETKAALQVRAESVQGILDLLEPGNEKHEKLTKTLVDAKTRDFAPDTLANWMKENGPVIAAAAVTVAIVTIGSAGTATPLATVLVSSAWALGATQGTKEFLYLVNHNIGDTGLGAYNDRSYHGAWAAKHGTDFAKLVAASDYKGLASAANDLLVSYVKEVQAPLGFDYGQNVVMGLVGLGALRLGQSGLSGLNKEWVKSLVANPNSLKLIEMAERGAASSASKPMVSAWLQKIAIESGQEIGEEIGQEGVTAVAERALQQANVGGPMASMLLAASMGMAQGKLGSKLLGRVQGDHLHIDLSVQDSVVESLRASGHFVESLPDGSFAASNYDRPNERLQISIMNAADAPDKLAHARLYPNADGKKTELETNRHTLDLPNEKIVARDSLPDGDWEPSDYSVEVRRTINDWSKSMASGDFEKALQIAQSSKHEPMNRSEDGFGKVPIAPTLVRVEIDYSKLKDINSEAFQRVLAELSQPNGKSCNASMVTERTKAGNDANDEIRTMYGFRMADPVVVVPAGTEVEVAGKKVKLDNDREIALLRQEHNLDPVSQALLTQIKESEAGQRLIAEQALVAMEERLVHLSQFSNAKTKDHLNVISPTLAQYLSEKADTNPVGLKALLGIPTELTNHYKEMEVAALLYDSGFGLQDIQSMLANRHNEEREPLYDWLRAKNQSSSSELDALSEKISSKESGNRNLNKVQQSRHATTGTGIETEVDRTIQEYVRELAKASPAQAAELKAKITGELVDKGREYAAKMGLVTRDSSGNITDYMISEKNIFLTQEGDFNSYNLDNTIEINLNHPDPSSALWHEMKHMSEMLERTSLYAADPEAFERRLREEVFGELAQGGDLRIINRDDGELGYEARTELETFEQRSNLKSLLMDYTENNILHSRQQVEKWLGQQPEAVTFFAQQGIDKDALSKLMSAELVHYEQVKENATLDAQVLYRDPKLGLWTEAKAQHFRSMAEARNATLYDEPQLHKLTRAITEETLGIAGAPGHYDILSPAERRAHAVELTRNIQTLTTQLNSHSAIDATVSLLQFNSTTQALTKALGKLRSDVHASTEALSQARQAASDLVTMLPDNEAGKNVAERLLGMNLIDAKQVPQKLLSRPIGADDGRSTGGDEQLKLATGKRLSRGRAESGAVASSKPETTTLSHKEQLYSVADLNTRIQNAPGDLQKSLNSLVKVAGGDAKKHAVIDQLLKMDLESISPSLKELIKPDMIKVMRSEIFSYIRTELNMGRGDANVSTRQEKIAAYDQVPGIDFAASKRQMKESREAGTEPIIAVDMLAVLEAHKYSKKDRYGEEYAFALKQTEFCNQFKDSISDAQVIAEGNESVVMKVKGPFVLGEGASQVVVDEMALKLTKPLRGEWHEDWGNWRERPWDALTVLHENIDGIDIYVQEVVQAGISPQHEAQFRKSLREYNKEHTGRGDDRYVLWDGDNHGAAGKQFGYSSLPVRPEIDQGSVWVNVNGQPRRIVLLDHWAVKRYGEDGKAEFDE